MAEAVTRWLVVGAGRHAERFGLPGLAGFPTATTAALCGSDEPRVADLAARHGVPRWSTSLEELLGDPAITHVYVCSANGRHERQVMLAAAAGKHVLCEKPLAPDPAAARRMVDACRRRGVVLGTGFHLRHNAANAQARRLVAEGAIGDPLWARVDYLHALRDDDSARRLAASRSLDAPSAGALAGTGAHAIDLARWLLGEEITSVAAAMAENDPLGPFGPQRVVHVTGTAARGALVTVTAGRSRYPRNGVTVTGSRGHVAVTGSTGYRGGGLVRIACDGGERVAEVAPHDVYRSQFEAFAAATAAGGPASASGADGEAALRVADAAERSLTAGGAPVTVAGGAPATVFPAFP